MSERGKSGGAPRARECGSFIAGHNVHWIQWKRSMKAPGLVERGRIETLEGDVVAVLVDGVLRRYRHHDLPWLAQLMERLGPQVEILEGCSLLIIGEGVDRVLVSISAGVLLPCSPVRHVPGVVDGIPGGLAGRPADVADIRAIARVLIEGLSEEYRRSRDR